MDVPQLLSRDIGNQLVVERLACVDGVNCDKGFGGVEDRCRFFITLVAGTENGNMPGPSSRVFVDAFVVVSTTLISGENSGSTRAWRFR